MSMRRDRANLMQDAPPYRVSLEKQKANLMRFYEDNKKAFSRLPYTPWIIATPKTVDATIDLPTVIRPSHLIPGCLGGFLQSSLPVTKNTIAARGAKHSLGAYSGLIMSDRLLHEFVQKYHCPTAIKCSHLDYVRKNGDRVTCNVVGDPTCAAAMFNDARGTDRSPNASLLSVNSRHASSLLRVDGKTKKINVLSSIIRVWLNPASKFRALMKCWLHTGPNFGTINLLALMMRTVLSVSADIHQRGGSSCALTLMRTVTNIPALSRAISIALRILLLSLLHWPTRTITVPHTSSSVSHRLAPNLLDSTDHSHV